MQAIFAKETENGRFYGRDLTVYARCCASADYKNDSLNVCRRDVKKGGLGRKTVCFGSQSNTSWRVNKYFLEGQQVYLALLNNTFWVRKREKKGRKRVLLTFQQQKINENSVIF